jgi:hypothetical protein
VPPTHPVVANRVYIGVEETVISSGLDSNGLKLRQQLNENPRWWSRSGMKSKVVNFTYLLQTAIASNLIQRII